MVGAQKGKNVNDQPNLFATPVRPQILRLSIERLWEKGDDVVSVSGYCWGAKGAGPGWVTHDELVGPEWAAAVQGVCAARIGRFNASLWDKQPSGLDYERALQVHLL